MVVWQPAKILSQHKHPPAHLHNRLRGRSQFFFHAWRHHHARRVGLLAVILFYVTVEDKAVQSTIHWNACETTLPAILSH